MTTTPQDIGFSVSESFATDKWNMTVAQLLLEYFKLEGVDKVFGIPGGAVIYIADELMKQRDQFDFVICRQETGAAYIAHGYARVSGELGVVLTTSGPAAVNALTGSMNAQASNASLLTITGECAEKYFGMGYLQEGIDAQLDVSNIYQNAVEFSAVITSPQNFQTLFQQALRDARSQPPRASHVSIPNNVGGECIKLQGAYDKNGNRIPFPNSPLRYRTVPGGTDNQRTSESLDELVRAQRPLIFLGNGARRALEYGARLDNFMAFVDRFAIPVMTTPDAKGIFPETHPLSLRNYGMTACNWPDIYMQPKESPEHYDALMVFGSKLGELATSVVATHHWSKTLIPSHSFVQVDLDQSVIARDFPITRGIVADVGATLDAMIEEGARLMPDEAVVNRRKSLIAGIKQNENSAFHDPVGRDFTGAPVHPAAVCRVIQECMDNGNVFIDAGNCVGWSLNNMVIDPPVRYHSSLDMGPMGFAVGAVIGGKIADPDTPSIAIVGDGAFMMHGSEISTAAQNRVGAIWVVLYNNDLGMVSQGMGALFPPDRHWGDYYELGAPDLVKYSAGLGAHAVAVRPDQDLGVFEGQLRLAINLADETRQPQVIVVHIDTEPMPHYGWPTVPKHDCSKA
jgi:acetolactate synthase-1/2/3 large subunit